MRIRISTFLAGLWLLGLAHAAVPEAISYQGRALTTTGGLVGAGTPVTRTITFRIWDHPSNSLAANLMYSEQQMVTIAEGEFSVLIGTGVESAGTPLGYSEEAKGPPTVKISDAFGGRSRYLGVTIDDGTSAVDREIFPRQQMVSTAYAFRSNSTENVESKITTAMIAEGVVTTDSIADNAITAAKIVDGAIVTEKIADGAVARASIADRSISLAKLAGPPIPVGMARIPGGTFTMGNTMSADTDIAFASPVSVTISEFWLGTHTVTYSEWLAVYQWAIDNGYSFANVGSGKFPNHPVHSVSWNDAVKWCNARSEKEGLTPVYYSDTAHTGVYRAGDDILTNEMVKWSANGYRLPTEAEWERAARGGLAGQRFPWGDIHISHALANYKTSNDGRPREAWDLGPDTSAASLGYHVLGSVGGTRPATSAVGSFAPNGYGLYDMAGNVFQFCWDWLGTADGFGEAAYVGGLNPRGPSINNALVTRDRIGGSWSDGRLAGGPYRAIRGGAWGNPALTSEQERLSQTSQSCRTAVRRGSTSISAATTVGFRVARSGLVDGAGASSSGLLALATPVFSPVGGEHSDPLIVTITSPDGANIIYTTDGSDPLKYWDSNGNENATTAASPVMVPISASGTVTLRARAIQSTRISLPTRATYELLNVPLAEVVIAQVTVGNAGNESDPATGFGAVNYEYKIAKNETTISQYAIFLNAVARTDTYGLYNTGMTDSRINGISRSGIPGAYSYTVNPGSGNKPITFVNWFNAARFANWMHNGQPKGAQNASSTENGAYPLLGKTSGIVAKNSGAKFWIPSENEWYKAAYYDPNKSGTGAGGYLLHTNKNDVMTSNTVGVAGASNHLNASGYAVYMGGTSWGITDVGAYGTTSESAYGTNDQAGNVSEWTDGVGVANNTLGVVRGGAWDSVSNVLSSTSSGELVSKSTGATFTIGFRVAATTKNYDAIDGLIPLIAPVFSPIGGEYPSPLAVTITSPDGADILYTTDGSDPLLSDNSKVTSATSPASVSLSALGASTLRAHAVGTSTVSPPSVAVYELFEAPPAAPVFSPMGGEHLSPLIVTITSPDGVGLIYTTDGSDPLLSGNNNATQAASPASVPLSVLGSTTLRAYAVGTTTVSPQTRADYELYEALIAPVFSPLGGEYRSPLTVTITSPDGADIVYTTDGSDPLLAGNSKATSVPSPASVSLTALGEATYTLRAHAFSPTKVSPQTLAIYELFEVAPTAPVFSPMGGTHPSPLTVTITSPDGVGLVYTTDGSDPLLPGNNKATEAASPVSVPLSVLGAATLRAHAVGPSMASLATSAVYQLFEVRPAAPVFSPMGGEHLIPLTVTITSPDGAEIIYTTDGSDPLLSGNSKATKTASPASVPLSALGSTKLRAHAVGTTMVSLATTADFELYEPVIIDYVSVGNPGNAANAVASVPVGAVAYPYRIGKYEVTNAQYVVYLNSVDPDGARGSSPFTPIYDARMGTDLRAGITLNSGGAIGSKYTVRANMGNKPVNYVSWYDAARFANWLHNGQGSGDTEDGAYTLEGNFGLILKNPGARVWIPSEDEWYKAAYYDPTKGGTGGYWLYPTQSDTAPTRATATTIGNISNPGSNVANWAEGASWNGRTGNVTTVGSAAASNYYGTFDMGGNVREWNDGLSADKRGSRGEDSFASPSLFIDVHMRSDRSQQLEAPGFKSVTRGFRVASVLASLDSTPPAAPIFSPAGGEHLSPLDVTITSPDGADIIYTTDGSDPLLSGNSNATSVSSPAIVQLSALGVATLTLRAHTFLPSVPTMVSSPTSAAYTLNEPVIEPVMMDYVTVGNAGNAANTAPFDPVGAVAYPYKIGKYEVTNAQYAAFLNSVDPDGANTNGIYDTRMATDRRGGITYTSGAASGAKYTIKNNMGDKPVNYVSWYEAARFANWMHNNQRSGSAETGSYTLSGNTGSITKNVGATVWVPSEDEWYKAAYYDPTKDGTGGYWLYPTQSDTAPTRATATTTGNVSNPGSNVANWNAGAIWNGRTGNVTTVGSAAANNYYGTFDMGGNVGEWNDGLDPDWWIEGPQRRGFRGESYSTTNFAETVMRSDIDPFFTAPTSKNGSMGFRVASVFSVLVPLDDLLK